MNSAHEERIAFCVAEPVSTLVEADYRFLTEQLTRGPEGVLDLRDPDGGRLVASIVERAESEANSAELIPLGIAGAVAAFPALFARAVDLADALARTGVREILHVPLAPRVAGVAPQLAEMGFVLAHTCHTMSTPDASYRVVEPPPGFRFVDWHPGIAVERIDDLVVSAFTGTPAFMRAPLDVQLARLKAARPAPRILLDERAAAGEGAALAGVLRLRAPEADGAATISLVARHPRYARQRLGDVLVSEAMRALAAEGAASFVLEVVAVNRRALALYERHGFVQRWSETIWSRSLR